MSDEDAVEITIEVTRGTSTDDRDKMRAKVSAPNVDLLEDRVEAVKARMESWADDLRSVQPEKGRGVDEDQSELSEVRADA